MQINTKLKHLIFNILKKLLFQKKKINKKINILFWYRGGIKLSDWIHLINLNKINQIIYFRTKDTLPEKNLIIINKKKIKFITKQFLKNSEFLKMIDKSDVFICPRRKEGIGMAQVEALSKGKYLIGYNDATMSEYICNSYIGTLINNKVNKTLKLNNVSKYLKYRLNYNSKGYKEFQKNKNKIISFLKIKKNIKRNLFKKFFIMSRYYIILIYRKIFFSA